MDKLLFSKKSQNSKIFEDRNESRYMADVKDPVFKPNGEFREKSFYDMLPKQYLDATHKILSYSLVLYDKLSSTAVNTSLYKVGFFDIDDPTSTVDTGATLTESNDYLDISGATAGGGNWFGKGIESQFVLPNSKDWIVEVEAYMDDNTTNSSLSFVELTTGTKAFRFGLMNDSTALKFYTGYYGTSEVYAPTARVDGNVKNKTWHKITVMKFGDSIYAHFDDKSTTGYYNFINADLTLKLIGGRRVAPDEPISRFRNLKIYEFNNKCPSFTYYTGNPILSPSGGAAFDSDLVKDAEVIKVGSTYYLYYTAYDGSDYSSGRAHSNSIKGPYTKDGELTLSDAQVPIAPAIYYENGVFHGFFQTGSAPNDYIKYYTSTDGLTFTLVGTALAAVNNTWEDGVYDPSVFYHDNKYYLTYAATGPTYNTDGYTRQLGIAECSTIDGTWSNRRMLRAISPLHVRDNKGVEGVYIKHTGYNYYLGMVCGLDGNLGSDESLGFIVSEDLTTFYKMPIHIFKGMANVFEQDGRGHGSFLIENGIIYVFYQGDGGEGIGVTEISLTDLTEDATAIINGWSKIPDC